MDMVRLFDDELQSLLDIKPPVSKAKMGLITRAAMKGVKFYKHIVQITEKFILRCRPEYKVPGLYVIDSIVRQSRHQFGIERDVYAARFSRNLPITFRNLFVSCLPEDKPKIVRVLNLWQKNGVFSSITIQPLLDMSTLDTIPLIDQNSLSATSPTGSIDNHMKQGQSSKYGMPLVENPKSIGRHQKTSDRGLKFSKNLLDFDYDEDDEEDGDETPTEAEPPLSSTLNRIEMEQRGQAKTELLSGNSESAYHSSQPQAFNQSSNPTIIADQDPVLERWNRLIGQLPYKGETPVEYRKIASESRARRSRSRSPSRYSSKDQDRPSEPLDTKRHKTQETTNAAQAASSSTIRDAEREADRKRKCLPRIRDKHVTVCSSTLWLGHVPKAVTEADISNAFGEYGSIASIDLIPPRGCAYVCMDRRQDAKRALNESKDLKLNGSHIKMAWAPGKGFKQYNKLKDFWESDTGSSFIPYYKIDESIDFDLLEEGGVIDDDSMSMEMRERRERRAKEKINPTQATQPGLSIPVPTLPILAQRPPPATMAHFQVPPPNLAIPPPPPTLGHGVIPFPPPCIPTSLMSHMAPQPVINHLDHQDHKEHGNTDDRKTPDIDQQISMTEQQISMVEQQLNFMQQAQGFHHQQQHLHQHPMFQHGQSSMNPMLFDMHQQAHLIQNAHQMLNPQQMAMYQNQPILGHPPHMLPVNQPSIPDASSLNEHAILHQRSRY